MSVLLIPTLGPFHILHPRYNAVTVLELVKRHQPGGIYLASYGPQELSRHAWRDDNEVSLFHVLPWAESANLPVRALDAQSHLKAEADRFREALAAYPKGQEILRQAGELDALLQAFLTTPKTPEDFGREEALEALKTYLDGYAKLFGEGPATGFRRERMAAVASSVQSQAPGAENPVVLADLLDYVVLRELLPEAQSPKPSAASEAERQRSVLDRAWRLEEADDWALLLGQLQEVEGPEAMYCAAQIYLAAGQPEDAFQLLDQLVHTEFHHPEYLPGYALARYGQLADVLGQRDKALRAYAAVLALSWVPQEVKDIALAGHKTAYQLGT